MDKKMFLVSVNIGLIIILIIVLLNNIGNGITSHAISSIQDNSYCKLYSKDKIEIKEINKDLCCRSIKANCILNDLKDMKTHYICDSSNYQYRFNKEFLDSCYS